MFPNNKILTTPEFFKYLMLIAAINLIPIGSRKATLECITKSGALSADIDWVADCINAKEEKMPEMAAESLMGMCREGYARAK